MMPLTLSEPQITIVIPVYNRRGIVCRTLDTVLAQTVRPLSLIVVDNNSTDGTYEVIAGWRERHRSDGFDVRILSETVPGAAAARQCGLDHVSTPWVLFFDSDDLMTSGHVERALQTIAAHPVADVVGWPLLMDELNGRRRLATFEARDFWWENVFHGQFGTLRWCARTELVRRAGGWNPAVRFWDDIEIGARILALNPAIVRAEGDVTVHVIAGEESVTGPSNMSAFEKYELPLSLMAESMPPETRVWLDFKRAHFLGLCYRESHGDEVRRRARALFRNTRGLKNRIVARFVYHYTRLGGRGVAHLIKPFYKVK